MGGPHLISWKPREQKTDFLWVRGNSAACGQQTWTPKFFLSLQPDNFWTWTPSWVLWVSSLPAHTIDFGPVILYLCMSQFFKINLFLHTHTCKHTQSIGFVSLENSDKYREIKEPVPPKKTGKRAKIVRSYSAQTLENNNRFEATKWILNQENKQLKNGRKGLWPFNLAEL